MKMNSLMMKFKSIVLIMTLQSTHGMAIASPLQSKAAGGTGVHVPVGKDGDGLYTASTKGMWSNILLIIRFQNNN